MGQQFRQIRLGLLMIITLVCQVLIRPQLLQATKRYKKPSSYTKRKETV